MTRSLLVASMLPTVLRAAPRKNHKWGIRHLAQPIRDVESAGRREPVAAARYKCGFEKTCELAYLECSFVISFALP
jgi:hypothetical protein